MLLRESDVMTEQLFTRTTAADAERLRRAARKAGSRTLAAWIRTVTLEAAEKELTKR